MGKDGMTVSSRFVEELALCGFALSSCPAGMPTIHPETSTERAQAAALSYSNFGTEATSYSVRQTSYFYNA